MNMNYLTILSIFIGILVNLFLILNIIKCFNSIFLLLYGEVAQKNFFILILFLFLYIFFL
jgi:hypothetical protein